MEPYFGSAKKTLVTYLAHVSDVVDYTCTCITHQTCIPIIICHYMQLDLINVPAIVSNNVIGRHPLAIHYLRMHLLPRSVKTAPIPMESVDDTNSKIEVVNKQKSFEDSSECSEFMRRQ